ncbi:MAG: glycerol-3-phosphate 1-O-acyltransferase PlsY [Anaerovoracaceae bacterium]|nr:glycerol-3-phosphate 1-O-acyltransferase PlsY [Anaerovoracaceae bacterium]
MFSSIYTDSTWALFALAIVIAYALGDLSGAQIISRSKGVDIKKEGSGNAGTTNVLRVLGIKSAVGTLAIDVLKGTGAVLLGDAMAGRWCAMLCALAVVAGHVWPAAYKFKGGKGVATIFGATLGLDWRAGLLALLCVVIGVLISRMMSMGSIVGVFTYPVIIYFLVPDFFIFSLLLALLVLLKHTSNIKRMLAGEEPHIRFRRGPGDEIKTGSPHGGGKDS